MRRRSSRPQVRGILLELPAGHDGRERAGAAGRRHRSDRLLQRRVLRRPEAVRRPGVARRHPDEGAAHRCHRREARGLSRHHVQLHPAGGGRRRRGRDRSEELTGREDLRRRSADARGQGGGGSEDHRDRARHHRHHGRPGAGPAQPHGDAGPREDRALRTERRRHQHDDRDGGRRHAGDAGHSGRAIVRPRHSSARAVPGQHRRDQEHPDRDARRPEPAAQPVRRHPASKKARRSSIARATRGSSACSSASRAATWRAPCRKPSARSKPPCRCRARLHVRLGWRIPGVPGGTGRR